MFPNIFTAIFSRASLLIYLDRETFVNAVKTVEELREKHGLNLPVLLLANKTDVEHKRLEFFNAFSVGVFLIRKPFFCLTVNFLNIVLEIRLRFS